MHELCTRSIGSAGLRQLAATDLQALVLGAAPVVAAVDGEGHLHIYANGQKLGRLYGTATHIPALPEGDVEITVGAFSNDHSPYVIDGEPVEASTTITVAS